MIEVEVHFRLKDGDQTDIRAMALQLIADTRAETGCIFYDLLVSLSDPCLWRFVETWRSRDDLAAHNSSRHVQLWRAATTDWFMARPDDRKPRLGGRGHR